MKFRTQSGSIYEVDFSNKRFRRVSHEQGKHRDIDEGWLAYNYTDLTSENLYEYIGHPVYFFFAGHNENPLRTSRVVGIVK